MNSGILVKLCVQLLKVLGSGNFPSLACNLSSSSFVRSSSESSSFLCFITTAFWHKSSNSAFLSHHRLIVYLSLANNFSIHQLLISRNLHCMSYFHLKPPCLIRCNALSLDLVCQFRHQISKLRELGNGLLQQYSINGYFNSKSLF